LLAVWFLAKEDLGRFGCGPVAGREVESAGRRVDKD